MLPLFRAQTPGETRSATDPPRQLRGPLGPPPSPFESAAMSAVRAGWNIVLSLVVGTMLAAFAHAFVSEAMATLFGPLSASARFGLGLAAWLAGGSVAFVMFVSYYLDDSGR
jgi:hypothetical protein